MESRRQAALPAGGPHEPISCTNRREGYNKWLQITSKTIARNQHAKCPGWNPGAKMAAKSHPQRNRIYQLFTEILGAAPVESGAGARIWVHPGQKLTVRR